LRLNEPGDSAFDLALSDERLALATLHRNSLIARQLVNQHEPQVMARLRVSLTRIAQTNNEH